MVALPLAVAVGVIVSHRSASAQAAERVLYVSVLDSAGKPVENVQPADLQVREDGVAREILRITPATDPMQLAVLVDNSAAAERDIQHVRTALDRFVTAFRPQDELSLVTIAERPTLLVDATRSGEALKAGIGRIFSLSSSGAYLLDAIRDVCQGFRKREALRPVIVSITTQGVEFSNTGHEAVLEALESAGAALHAVVLTQPGNTEDLTTQEGRSRAIVLDRGTRETGGARHDLLTSLALEPELTALAAELVHQVKVVYASPRALIPPDRITVEAARPGLTARGQPVRISKEAR